MRDKYPGIAQVPGCRMSEMNWRVKRSVPSNSGRGRPYGRAGLVFGEEKVLKERAN